MKFSLLNKTCCSATFELINHEIYKLDHKYDVFLNGEKVLETDRNVFSLFNLKQDTEYKVSIDIDEVEFKTEKTSYILHTKDFIRGKDEKDDTLALQMAICMTPKDGLLIFDEGEYHIRSLFLKSDITIEFKKGAMLLGSTDIDDYPLGWVIN